MADTIGMSPDTHLGLALNMLEHLPITPTSLSFMSGILLLMAHSPEVLTYQGEGIKGSNFQLIENSTAAAVLNQKLQQLLAMPESAMAPLNPDTSTQQGPVLYCLTPWHSSPAQPGSYALGWIPSVSQMLSAK